MLIPLCLAILPSLFSRTRYSADAPAINSSSPPHETTRKVFQLPRHLSSPATSESCLIAAHNLPTPKPASPSNSSFLPFSSAPQHKQSCFTLEVSHSLYFIVVVPKIDLRTLRTRQSSFSTNFPCLRVLSG